VLPLTHSVLQKPDSIVQGSILHVGSYGPMPHLTVHDCVLFLGTHSLGLGWFTHAAAANDPKQPLQTVSLRHGTRPLAWQLPPVQLARQKPLGLVQAPSPPALVVHEVAPCKSRNPRNGLYKGESKKDCADDTEKLVMAMRTTEPKRAIFMILCCLQRLW
jgi:hypothetical protein